jgi:hypothetical protein
MLKVTVKEFAKHRKITERSVFRYLLSGGIPAEAKIKEGRKLFIDQEAADAYMDDNFTPRRVLLAGAAGHVPPTPLPSPVMAVEDVTVAARTAGLSYTDARALSQRYKAALLKLEIDERTGKLVDAEQIKAVAFGKARTLRDSLLNIPDRLAPILAAEGDQVRVSEILAEEIRAALEELTR